MLARGEDLTLAEVQADLRRRDERDRNRAVAPLIAAEEAITLDTTGMGVEQAIAAAIEAVERAAE
jgi:cytidylate kinase